MRYRLVGGGTEFWEGVNPMPRRRKLDHEQELELFEMVRKGFSNKDIAKKFGISADTVSVYYRRTLRERSKEREPKERLVAHRKFGQTLTFSVDGGYVGHTTVNDVEDTCSISAQSDIEAIGKFDKWLDKMDAEQQFLNNIMRASNEVPEIEVKRKQDDEQEQQIYDQQHEIDAQVEEHLGTIGVPLADTSEPAYLIWAKRPEPRCYGLYLTMDDALRELDKLNSVATFLGSKGAFEVEEVEWKVGQ